MTKHQQQKRGWEEGNVLWIRFLKQDVWGVVALSRVTALSNQHSRFYSRRKVIDEWLDLVELRQLGDRSGEVKRMANVCKPKDLFLPFT